MPLYPLMFTFRDAVSGNGFLAGVTLSGRALMVHEDDSWWIYGVRPGALAETGQTPQEAFLKFRNTYKTVLFDMAEESADFESLKKEVERFYYEPDDEEERRWMEAFRELRSGKMQPEPPFSSLPKEAPETRPTQITVERLDAVTTRFTVADNIPDMYARAA
jgi:hypothetical protein